MGHEIAADLLRVDEMRHAEALAPLLLGVVDVHPDDHVGARKPQSLDDIEADAAQAKYRALRSRLDLRGIEHGADTGRDPAADVANLVERRVLADLCDRDLWQHSEIRERGCPHVVV